MKISILLLGVICILLVILYMKMLDKIEDLQSQISLLKIHDQFHGGDE